MTEVDMSQTEIFIEILEKLFENQSSTKSFLHF